MKERICEKKGCKNQEIQEHHMIPKEIGGNGGNGDKIFLCKKHHDVLHFTFIKIVWQYIPEKDHPSAKQAIRDYTNWWMRQEEYKTKERR